MFRWGILSTAKIAREVVIPAHLNSQKGVITAIASRSGRKAAAMAARFGIPHWFGSYEELLASDEVDGVYIPLPTSQHIEWSLKAASAGKHVLCEKPIALRARDIAPLKRAAKKHNVLIAEAFMVYHHPQWHKVRELVSSGAIGRLRHVQGAFSYFNRNPKDMRNQPELGGGGLPDIGVYPTVTTRIVTGREPRRVHAEIEFDRKFGTDCYASVKADFSDFDLSFYVSTQMALRQFMVFHGEKGFVEVHAPFNAGAYDHASITLHNQDHSEATTFRFHADQYAIQADNFVEMAQGGSAPLFSLDNSVANQKVIDAIYRAGKSGRWEKV